MDSSIIFNEAVYDLIIKHKLNAGGRDDLLGYLISVGIPRATAYEYVKDVNEKLVLSSRSHADAASSDAGVSVLLLASDNLEVIPPELVARRVASSLSDIEHDTSFDASAASQVVLVSKVRNMRNNSFAHDLRHRLVFRRFVVRFPSAANAFKPARVSWSRLLQSTNLRVYTVRLEPTCVVR